MIPIGDARRRFGFPWMTLLLLLVSLIVFLYERRVPLDGTLGLVPADLASRPHVGVLAKALLGLLIQGPGWVEPLVNLVYLWILGQRVEDACGPAGFLLVGIFCGIGGVALKVIVDPQGQQPVYGLAGVVAGLFGAYFVLYRMERIRTFIPPLFLTAVPSFLHLLWWAGWEFVFLNVDFAALRALKWAKIVAPAPNWPFVGALLIGLLAGPLFARREFLFYRSQRQKAATSARR